MRQSAPRTALAWLCLFAFVLNGAIAPGALVVCRDADGRARIELGCDKTPEGGCLARCGAADHEEEPGPEPHPCQDQPIELGEWSAVHSGTSADGSGSAASLFTAAVLHSESPTAPATPVMRAVDVVRPPGVLRQWRTVILLI